MKDTARTGFLGVSQARWTAYVAVLGLCGVIAWNTFMPQPALSPTIAAVTTPEAQKSWEDYLAALDAQMTTGTSTEGITALGTSIFTQAVLAYDEAARTASSSQAGLRAVEDFGATVQPQVSYRTYAAGDIVTVSDTSKDRVLAYRADLRIALEPLLENKKNELDLFAQYVDTKDTQYLNELHIASGNYKRAVEQAIKVATPVDAASYHAGILTAMSEFSATLDALTEHASDPLASAALLRSYISAQDNMLASFNSIGKYSANKTL